MAATFIGCAGSQSRNRVKVRVPFPGGDVEFSSGEDGVQRFDIHLTVDIIPEPVEQEAYQNRGAEEALVSTDNKSEPLKPVVPQEPRKPRKPIRYRLSAIRVELAPDLPRGEQEDTAGK
jgi:hypothetical protein